MAIEVLPANNTFTGTNADESANSTPATETFTMGGGTNTINFDLSGNKLLGADEIYLTPGENLVLNFTSQINFGSFMDYNELITWERVQNNDGTIDIAIKTKPFCTLGYMQRKTVTIPTEVDHTDYYGNPYFKAVVTESLYDYELDKWVEINSWNTYSKYDNEIYGLRALNSKGEIQDSWYGDTTSTDMHEDVEVEKRIGEVTTIIDYKAEPINTILIKNIGAKTANSVKLQYTNPDNTVKTYQEYVNGSYQNVDFITKNYAIGTKDSTENQVLQGSFLDETFYAGYGDDTINTVGGTNKIYLYNSAKDVTLGTGEDYVYGDFSEYSTDYYHQSYYACLDTNNVANGITIRKGNSDDTLLLYYYGTNNFYKDGNNLVIIQNWQYNSNGTRLSKFTLEDYFSNEDRIDIKHNQYTISFNESNTEVYCKNSDGYIAYNNYYLDMDGEIYSRNYNYNEGNYTYTHVTQNSTILYNRLGITLDDFSEYRNSDYYYETGEINGKVYYAYYKDNQSNLYTKENGTYTKLVEYKSAKFANDLGIVWENATAVRSIVESGESTVSGTNSSEAIIATAESTITTGNGDDIIYTSSANDTIIIDGSGDKKIVLDSNSGDDIINIQNHEGKIYLYMPNSKTGYNSNNYGYNFYKDKNNDNKDLIIERLKEVYANGHYEYIPKGRTIIKDYFTFSAEQQAKIYSTTMSGDKAVSVRNLIIDGDEGESNIIWGTNFDDIITGKELADTIYTGKGEDYITPNQGDDLIEINDDGYKTIYISRTDGNDTIHLSGDALKNNSFVLRYNDGFTGLSHQIQDGNLVLYTTTVDGDDITTQTATITGITGGEVTAANIANYSGGGLNISGKINVYNNYSENTSWLSFKANTPLYIEGNKTTANNINAENTSNLVIGGSADDTITATGEINHVYTSAGNDTIDVTSTVQAVVYAGSGDDNISVTGGSQDYIYAEDGNDTINFTSGSATIYAGAGDDIINVSGGSANIYTGAGADIINITGGIGGYLCFTVGEGDKIVNFQNASDALYSVSNSGSYHYRYYYKDGNDLRIETQYNHNYDTDTHDVENYYLNNFFDPNHSKVDPYYTQMGSYYSTLQYTDLIIVGEDDPTTGGKIFEGTFCEDIIEGTDYVDTITLASNHDQITPGKGNDFITINGDGQKSIYLTKGDGNDTVYINEGVVFSGYANDRDPGVRLYNAHSYDSNYEMPENYSYSIDNGALTIYRTYNNGGNTLIESVKITGIRSIDENNPADITIENIRNESGGLNVSNRIYAGTYWDNVYKMNLGDENQANTLTTTAEIKNTVIGGAKVDTITSNGSDDYISAGAGNDIITSSAATATIYGGEGNDEITATSATATATLYGGEGNDTITSTAATATIYDDAGDDTVTVTGGTNNIYIGEGSDTIKIKGGQGTIYLSAGSGDNTVIFESNNADGTCHLDGDYNIAMSGSGWSSSYTKSGEDLIVYRYSSTTTDTVTIKGLFGDNQLANGNNLKINGWNLSSMYIEGNYDKKLKATVYSGSNYNDNISGTNGKDIITTGGGTDYIYLDKGDDKVIIDGSGDKYIYYNQGGNKEIQLGAGVDLGEIRLSSGDSSHASSYKIVNNDFVWYRTYIDGDKFTTESTRFTGITGGDVTYDNIMGYGDTQLNLTNKLKSRPYLQLTQGNFKKTNKITTKASTNNLVLGGKKNDTIVLNGLEDVVYSSAGADKITVNGEFGSDTVYAGSDNDTIILNANDKSVDIYGGKGNDKIYANGNSRYNIYGEKGDGNDTLILGKDFNQRLYFYNASGSNLTQQAHSIVNNNLILYRIYVDGDTITTNSVKVTGIKSRTDTPVEVNYNNISSSSGGLNISGSYISDFNKNMIQGSASKASKLSTKEGTYNVVLGGKKNDTVTLNGSYDNAYTGAGADSITIKAGNAHVYAGSGNDTINVKGGSSHQIYTGKGNDTVNITGASGTINLIAGEGNDTFRFTGSEHGNYNLNISGYNNYYNSYYKSGNDLLVKNTYTNAKKKTVTETHTIKDYFNNDNLENKLRINSSYISDRLSSNRLNVVGKYNKGKKATLFDGTKYDDIITGTKGKDIITTGAGYDQITAGKGNDTITINKSGDKLIYINNGDGNDIIQWANTEEEIGKAYIYFNQSDAISYKKSGTDLVITRTYESGNSLKSENTTIKGYYDAEGNVVEAVANNVSLPHNGGKIDPEKSFNRVNYKKPNINVTANYELAVGTAKADTITTTAENAAIFALAGNDTININGGNAFVTGGKGTDTININTTGVATICHLAGDGNDIVNFGENTPAGLRVNVDSSLFNNPRNANVDNYMYMSGKHGLFRFGDDLIYSIPTSSSYNTKAEKITFKDYFKEDVNKPAYISLNLSDYDYHLETLEFIASGNGIWVEGINNNGVTTYTGMDNYTNRYEYKGAGKTIINGANRADYYNVSINSKSNLYINDSGNQSGWGYDTLYINTDYKNLRALFNMSASGKVIVSEDDQYSDNFMIFNKGSLTYDNVKKIFSGKDGKGVINIDHVFSETTSYSTNGTGSIEYIYAGKDLQKQTYNSGLENNKNVQRLYTSLWVEDLGQEVASWLSANTDGSKTSFEIFETGTKDEINALLKVYNTVYDKNFST